MVLTSLPQVNEEKLIQDGATAYFAESLLTIDKESAPFVEAVEVARSSCQGKSDSLGQLIAGRTRAAPL